MHDRQFCCRCCGRK